MQLNPARGRKLEICLVHPIGIGAIGLCSSTPRGDGNDTLRRTRPRTLARFMQLNPARGRKQYFVNGIVGCLGSLVYAAQPREGTETSRTWNVSHWSRRSRFMQLNPARGRKLQLGADKIFQAAGRVYAAQPREGTETTELWQAYPDV